MRRDGWDEEEKRVRRMKESHGEPRRAVDLDSSTLITSYSIYLIYFLIFWVLFYFTDLGLFFILLFISFNSLLFPDQHDQDHYSHSSSICSSHSNLISFLVLQNCPSRKV